MTSLGEPTRSMFSVDPRYVDPATAPMLPVQFSLELNRHVFEVSDWELAGAIRYVPSKRAGYVMKIRGWDRATDKIHEYTLTAEPDKELEMIVRVFDPDPADKRWLWNIGAREGNGDTPMKPFPARMLKRHVFEAGAVLKKGARIVVWSIALPMVGIRWTDAEGNHVSAINAGDVERIPDGEE